MSEGKNLDAIMYAEVKAVTDKLSDEELHALFVAYFLDCDPRPALGYEKAKALFAEEDGIYMNRSRGRALELIWYQRIGSQFE